MPPRARGRGRGGRWSAPGSQRPANASSKIMKPLSRSEKMQRSSANGLDHNHSPLRRAGRISQSTLPRPDGAGVQSIHAIVEKGLLIVIGLQPEHFPDYDSEAYENAQHVDEDGHSDYASGPPRKSQKQRGELRLRDPAKPPHLADDDDWTETDVEVLVEAKSRGFYHPPAKREVVRLRVKKGESTRYNETNLKEVQTSSVNGDHVPHDQAFLNAPQDADLANEGLASYVEQKGAKGEVDLEDQKLEDDVPALEHEDPVIDEDEEEEDDAEDREEEEPFIELIDEGELSDSNFPNAFLKRLPPPSQDDCEDEADIIMKKRFLPMGETHAFVTALTKLDPSTRSVDVLFDIAHNAQQALKAWQDEYLELDLRTAPAANPPKKPLTGGRALLDPLVYEDMLEADLYDYAIDPKKQSGQQDPFSQRNGHSKLVGGRELRHRRARDVGGVDLSEGEGTGTGNEGYGTRRRRAALRGDDEIQLPPRGTKRPAVSGTSDMDGPPRKRGRQHVAEKPGLQSRIRQLREESLAVSVASSDLDGQSPEPPKRRGRPPGSKNTAPRSDAGIKKGPRKARLNVEYVDGDVVSQNDDPERLDTATPVSHPSGDDAMIVEDDLPQNIVNGKSIDSADAPQADVVMETTEQPMSNASLVKDDEGLDKDPKKRVRSEKRSKSMTEWWAARKAKAAEDRRVQLAQQAEADRLAEEQARTARAVQQAQQPPTEPPRYWPHVGSQHQMQEQQQIQAPPLMQYAPPPSQELQPSLPPQQGRPRDFYVHGPPPLGVQGGQQLVHSQPAQHPLPPTQMQTHAVQMQPRLHPQEMSHVAQHPVSAPPPPPPVPIHTQHLPQTSAPSPYGGSPIEQTAQQSYHHHHHGAPSQQQFGIPLYQQQQHQPPPPQFSPTTQSHPASRQPSPLRRIANYVSDPTRAAQPAGPPYQTIMTPGSSGSPTQPLFPGPIFRTGRTPPRVASSMPPASSSGPGEMMTAFQVDNLTNSSGKRTPFRTPLPGTASWRTENPGRKPFAAQGPAIPQHKDRGRMTGGEVQDLALAAIQPVKRRPMHDVIREQKEQQRELRERELGILGGQHQQQQEREGPRPLMRLQPAPPPHAPLPSIQTSTTGPPTSQQSLANAPPTMPPQQHAHESWYDSRHAQRIQQPPPPPSLPPQTHHHHHHHSGPPVDPNLPPPVGPQRYHSHHQHQLSYPPPNYQSHQSHPSHQQQQQHHHHHHHHHQQHHSYSSSIGLPPLAPAAERQPQPPRLPPYQDMAQGLGPSLAPAPPPQSLPQDCDRDRADAASIPHHGRTRSVSGTSISVAHPGPAASRDVTRSHMRFVEMMHGDGRSGSSAGDHGHG